MKITSLLISICLIGFFSFGQQDTLLKKKIDSLMSVDQQVQVDMIIAYQNNAGKKIYDSLDTIKVQTFKRNIPVLKEILKQKGLPTYQLVGKESADNFLTLVNHSFTDIPLQERVAKLASAEVKKNNISSPDLALMIDKMRIKSGRKQLYGTQCDYDKDGNAIALNLYKAKAADKRRKQMGLPPLSEYLKMMTELHQQMNQKK